jgi:hypothetical protein
MESRQQIWQRLVIVSHRLARLCDIVAGEMVYNRTRRDAWFAHTVAWKKAWLHGELPPEDPDSRRESGQDT